MPPVPPPSIFAPGHNCWRVVPASRVAVIVDGADYFAALRTAMMAARKQILLVGWDFDTRVRIDHGDTGDDGPPATIGDFILWLAAQTPELCINILMWDFGVVKLARKGSNLLTALEWKRHRGILLKSDSYHPLGGSLHHKLAIIDDRIAFCGGIDITTDRWDTPRHRDDDTERRNPDGRLYSPWHDLALAVEGPVAAALGDLARDRWRRAGGEPLPVPTVQSQPWPGLDAGFRDIDVAIARTRPGYLGDGQIREIESLFVDMIEAAQRFVYVENQYFASRRIAEAIAKRLAEPDGPEFVIINPIAADGWISETAMGAARAQLLDALGQGEGGARLRVYTPVTEGGAPIYVHAKLMIVDDRLLRIGSANFNNRSLSLDGECDLTLEAVPGSIGAATITTLREGLMAEHLGCEPVAVAECYARSGTLVGCIEALRGSGRTLVPFVPPRLTRLQKLLADLEVLDPERDGDSFEPLGHRNLLRQLRRYRRARQARRETKR